MEFNKFITEYVTSRKNLLDMLEDRGCNVSAYRTFSPAEVKVMIQQTQNNKSANIADPGPLDIITTNRHGTTTYVKYKLEKIKASKSLDSFIIKVYETYLKQGDELIVMVPERASIMSSSFTILLNNFYNEQHNYIQIFGVNQLLRKVITHSAVPKHRLLSLKETNKLIQDRGLTDQTSLARINRNDPVAQYYGILPGEVFEITRKSPTSGFYITYRSCF